VVGPSVTCMHTDLLDDPLAKVEEEMWAQRGFTLEPPEAATRRLLDRLAETEPGPRLAGLLEQVDQSMLDGDARVDVIRHCERMAAWVSAVQQRALSTVVEATVDLGLESDMARHEVGAALRLSAGTAYDRVRRAQALTGRLRDTLAALEKGAISSLQAAAIVDAVEPFDDAVAAEVQKRVLARAPALTLAETRRALRRAVIAADPDGAEARAEKAAAERAVLRSPLDDGMAELRAISTASDADLVWAELTRRAKEAEERLTRDGRPSPGMDALRLDALVAAVLRPDGDRADAANGVGKEPRGSSRVQVRVTVDLPTLLGLAENPAELAGYGPLPAALARRLAKDAEWVRLVTDPMTGELLDLGRHRYRPALPLDRFVRARDQVCRWPGCYQPAERCDLDHAHDFDRGGETTRANLGPLCRQHHNAKTHGMWRYRRDPDGTGHFTSPLGKQYVVRPPRYPPDG